MTKNTLPRPARKSTAVKTMEVRINKLYGQFCFGIQVPLMSIPSIFKAGMVVAMAGGTDEEVGNTLRDAALLASGQKPAPVTVTMV